MKKTRYRVTFPNGHCVEIWAASTAWAGQIGCKHYKNKYQAFPGSITMIHIKTGKHECDWKAAPDYVNVIKATNEYLQIF